MPLYHAANCNPSQTQMQLDNITKKQYTGSLHCVQTLQREFGVRILYTGYTVNTIREATFLSNYFFVYEGLRELLLHYHLNSARDADCANVTHSAKIAVPIAGGLAGALSWFVSFPLDCVRAGVQGQPLFDVSGLPIRHTRKSAMFIFRELMRERGIRGLYSGASASIARAFLVSGSRFSAYEGALWLLRGGRDIHPDRHNQS